MPWRSLALLRDRAHHPLINTAAYEGSNEVAYHRCAVTRAVRCETSLDGMAKKLAEAYLNIVRWHCLQV